MLITNSSDCRGLRMGQSDLPVAGSAFPRQSCHASQPVAPIASLSTPDADQRAQAAEQLAQLGADAQPAAMALVLAESPCSCLTRMKSRHGARPARSAARRGGLPPCARASGAGVASARQPVGGEKLSRSARGGLSIDRPVRRRRSRRRVLPGPRLPALRAVGPH